MSEEPLPGWVKNPAYDTAGYELTSSGQVRPRTMNERLKVLAYNITSRFFSDVLTPERLTSIVTALVGNALKLQDDDITWSMAAQKTGVYPGDTDISTPQKWLAAQSKALTDQLTEIENLKGQLASVLKQRDLVVEQRNAALNRIDDLVSTLQNARSTLTHLYDRHGAASAKVRADEISTIIDPPPIQGRHETCGGAE